MYFDEAVVAAALGSGVVHSRVAPWGNKNRTRVLRLADGRSVVLQRYSDPVAAKRRWSAAEQFAGAALRVAIPRMLASDLTARQPWAVFDRLPGQVAYVAAGDDLSGAAFLRISTDMGRIAGAIGRLDPARFSLPSLWSRPVELQHAAEDWAIQLIGFMSHHNRECLDRMLRQIPILFAGRPAVVAHGDFGPQNVLVAQCAVTGLLDFEDA